MLRQYVLTIVSRSKNTWKVKAGHRSQATKKRAKKDLVTRRVFFFLLGKCDAIAISRNSDYRYYIVQHLRN